MTKKVEKLVGRPNLFHYANRELSQDAMVCWLLKCLHSPEQLYQNIGLQFIRLVFDDPTIRREEVKLEAESPHKQYYHMDVYAVVFLRDKFYPIIFEDKTNTYLHDKQFENYCTTVADWMKDRKYLEDLSKRFGAPVGDWGEIIYVYFKTGYPFEWQKCDFDAQKDATQKAVKEKGASLQVTVIYLDKIVCFLERQERDAILDDYYEELKEQLRKRNSAQMKCFDNVESCEEALSNQTGANDAGYARFFEEIFGSKSYFSYSHQCWASRDIFTTGKNEKKITYNFRFEQCGYRRKEKRYAFQLQQYRDENKVRNAKDEALREKVEEAELIQKLCKQVYDSMEPSGVVVRFEKLKKSPGKSQMLMKIFIVGDSTPMNVCEYIKQFTKHLRNKVAKELNKKVELLDYKRWYD